MLLLSFILISIGAAIVLYGLTEGHWKSRNFWRQQFDSKVTGGQAAFDIIMGVTMPTLCLIRDPVVFQNHLAYGQSILGPIKVFAYTSIGPGILALSLWLLLSRYLKRTSAFVAGIFFYGALFALLLGILILPVSFIGLFGLIGVLGFTPFLSSLVFLRNGVRAYRQANEQIEKKWARGVSIILGVVLIILIPILMQAIGPFHLTTSN